MSMLQKYLDRILGIVSRPHSKTMLIGSSKFSSGKPVPNLRDEVLSKSRAAVSSVQTQLDTFFSISEVRDAQLVVSNIEKEFLEARRLASNMKKELTDVRVSLEEARKALDRCPRDSENFLRHVAEEHAIINKERIVRSGYEANEQKERELFTEYSNAVRVSHEKERERAQKTKHLSIIASVSGAVVGFLGSSLVTYYRFKQIRQMTSPDLIINKISHEIKENSLSKNDLDKLLEANAVTLVENLGEKLDNLGTEKLHLKDVGYSTSNFTRTFEETGKTIKSAEDELKKILDNYTQTVSEVSQNVILELKDSKHKVSEAKGGMSSHSDITQINEKLEKMEENIVNSVNRTYDDVLQGTNKIVQKEFIKMENNQREIKEHIISTRMMAGEGAMADIDLEMKSRATWYPEANLILSLFSFSLLIILVLNKN